MELVAAGSALLATAIISIIPVLLLFFVPRLTSQQNKRKGNGGNILQGKWLNWFLALAAGALLADAFLHLLPGHEHDHSGQGHGHQGNDHHKHGEQDSYGNGLAALFGITLFFVMEKITAALGHGHNHNHSHNEDCSDAHKLINSSDDSDNDNKSSHHHKEESATKIKTSGYLSLIADAVHNFTDGLAIAAAFSVNSSVGLSTTIAIFLHEIPHELGDYAILIKAGFDHYSVLKLQFITAASAFIGTFTGILLQILQTRGYKGFGVESVNATLPFAAGGFIYLALGSILPEILHNQQDESFVDALKQIVCFIAGIALMIVLD